MMKFQNFYQYLGAAETTLMSLTSAYAQLMEEKIDPKLISRIQDRRGKTIFQEKSVKCIGCDKFINNWVNLQLKIVVKSFQ